MGGHSAWTMDEQREREREALLKCWSFFLSLFVSLYSHGSTPLVLLLLLHLSFLLHPAPRRLWYTRSTRCPAAAPPPFAPSACLPSLLPGGLGQCWRRSRDLQEICLSEKQLVRLSTANVCMLGPPTPPLLLGGARARPVLGTVGALSPCLPVILFICRPSSCSLSPSDDPVFSNSTSAAKVCVLIYHVTFLHLYILLSPKASPKSRVRL